MQDTLLYIAGSALVLAILAILLLIRLELRLQKLLAGSKADSLEDVINGLHDDLRKQQDTTRDANLRIDDLDARVKKTIQSIRTVRFNPFQDAGSNQSFAIVMADEEGNGVVLSSLYGRERMSVYAKPIAQFTSEHELTDEEQEIIDERKNIAN